MHSHLLKNQHSYTVREDKRLIVTVADIETNQLSMAKENKVEEKERRWYDGNWSIWLVIGAAFSVTFNFVHGIPWTVRDYYRKDYFPIMYLVHYACVILFSVGFVANIFHTPGHGKGYRSRHVVIGRIAVVAGVTGQITGIIMAWTNRFNINNPNMMIGITVGGVVTVISSGAGYLTIKYGYVRAHQILMCLTFFLGGLIPGMMRIPEMLGVEEKNYYLGPTVWNKFAWIVPAFVGAMATVASVRKAYI